VWLFEIAESLSYDIRTILHFADAVLVEGPRPSLVLEASFRLHPIRLSGSIPVVPTPYDRTAGAGTASSVGL